MAENTKLFSILWMSALVGFAEANQKPEKSIEDTERDAIFQRLKLNAENNKCFDCDKKNPKWSSVYLGLYLCLDCAGKHREYGPQISFARSLNLDTWNKKYITFMELGGNAPALEFFKKHGLKTPYDYKNPIIQKYKQELTKKVDAALGNNNQQEQAIKPVVSATTKVEDSVQKQGDEMINMLAMKSFSDKPKHGEKPSDDPFANNIVINKGETKTKGFVVEFNKNKTGFSSNKGRIAAKKIENVDLDSLTLNEDAPSYSKNKFDMTESNFGVTNNKPEVKQVFAQNNSTAYSQQTNDDKLKKFQNAKAISSDAFKNQDNSRGYSASNLKQFSGATAISSAQYFGEREDYHNDEEDYYQTAENVKEFISTVGGKLKEKAEGFVSKVKQDWS